MTILETDLYKKWFSSLNDRNARARVLIRIRRLSLGNFGDVRSVAGNVKELRIHYGPGYRIYFTKRGEKVVLLLAGGTKSSQKRDIQTALEMCSKLKENS